MNKQKILIQTEIDPDTTIKKILDSMSELDKKSIVLYIISKSNFHLDIIETITQVLIHEAIVDNDNNKKTTLTSIMDNIELLK